jgi:hypothetical protein
MAHKVDGCRVKVWSGSPPVRCANCGAAIGDVFVDCKTVHGPWASVCVTCAGEVAASSSPALCRVFQLSAAGWVHFF